MTDEQSLSNTDTAYSGRSITHPEAVGFNSLSLDLPLTPYPTNPTDFLTLALWCHELGLNVLPTDGKKKPLVKWTKWKTQRQSRADIKAMPWDKARGIAVMCGRVSGYLICLDFDHQPDRRALNTVLDALGLPRDYVWIVITPGGGYHVWLIAPDFPTLDTGGKLDRPGLTAGPDHIELRYEGVLATLPPSEHPDFPDGPRYAFENGEPDNPPATVDPTQLIDAYGLITEPASESTPAIETARPYRPALPIEWANLYERWCVEVVEAAAVQTWQITSPNDRGWSRRNFRSPVRDDGQNPDCGWNYNVHGFKDFATDVFYNTHECAELLDIQTWEQCKADHRPTRPAVTISTSTSYVSRFPSGLPSTLSKRLRNIHRRANIQKQHPGDLVWGVWQELAGILDDDASFTISQFRSATQEIGRDLSRDTVETGFHHLVAWGIMVICDIFDPTIKKNTSSKVKKVAKIPKHPRKHYRFLPVDQQLANFERHHSYLLRERAFPGVPSDVQPEWGELDPEEIAFLDMARESVYEEYADQRGDAQVWLERNLNFLRNDLEHIRQGRYRAHVLPSGPIPNTWAYHVVLHREWLNAGGGQQENAFKAMFEVGCSRASLPTLRKANNSITIARVGHIPIEDVTDYQRTHKLVLAYRNGRATVKRPSAEKFAHLASEDEIQASEKESERQQSIRRQGNRPDAPPKGQRRSKSSTIPTAYSDPHILEQLAFTTGADQLPDYNTETGEVYTPAEQWRLMAKTLVAPDAVPEDEIQGTTPDLTDQDLPAPDDGADET